MNLINSINYGDYALNEIKKINEIYLEKINKEKNKSFKKNTGNDFDYISFKNLSIKFETNKIISYPNFNIKKNEKVLILSKSGKGKTTLLDIFCNFKNNENVKTY